MLTKIALSVSVISLAVAAPAMAETFKFTTGAPNGTPWVTHYEKSAENLAENSGGELSMEVFGGGQLGAETETIRQVARGRLDAGNFSVTAAASVVPEVTLLVSPFFWDSLEQADCALDNHLLPVFDALFEARGMKIIQWTELGYQILFSEEAITDVADIDGLSMRVAPAKNSDILWRGLGAAGVPLPFPEVAPNMQTGIIDGGELPTISYIATGLHNLAPHMTRTNHIYQPSVTLISLESWNGMNEDEQQIFMDSIESAADLRAGVRGAIAFFEGKMVDEGGTIHDLTDEQRAAWSAKYTEDMQQELIASVGGDAERVYELVVAARDACSG
jgi:TRAP-type C4-dicarboxylate transport system substrate-binding protein